jgi:hypothetical protein
MRAVHMIRRQELLLILAVGAVSAVAAENYVVQSDLIYEGTLKNIAEARALSDLPYYHYFRGPLERNLQRGENAGVTVTEEPWVRAFRRDFYLYRDEEGEVQKRLNYVEPARTTEQKQEAVRIYEGVVSRLMTDRKEGRRTDAPIEVVGVLYPLWAKVPPKTQKMLEQIHWGYQRQPSDLAAVAYLELALVKKDLGDEDGYRRVITKAVKELKVLEIHYCGDTVLRGYVKRRFNFARPETCLLFLAGEDARLNGRAAEARKYYTTIIERAPGSPFAWEALARLEVMGGTNRKQMEWLRSILLHTYPLVWGCPREDLKLDKDGFAAALPALLKKAGEEETKERETKRL